MPTASAPLKIMAIDEQEVTSIAINTLAPLVARLLGWIGASMATVGVTVNFGSDSALKIATIIVGLIAMALHQYMASKSNTTIAKSAFAQGSAAAGSTLLPSEIPPVVSGKAPDSTPVSTVSPSAIRGIDLKDT